MLKGEAGVGLVIAKSKAPVLPVRIFGAYEAFPRRAKLPKLFTRITVKAGDIIKFDESDLNVKSRERYQNISDQVMESIASIILLHNQIQYLNQRDPVSFYLEQYPLQ